MFGFTDYTEFRRNEQDVVRRAEQTRLVRERRESARKQAVERRAAELAARSRRAGVTRPRAV